MEERLHTVFRDLFDNPHLMLTDATTANDIPQWDSLRHLSLIEALEEEFSVRFSTAEMASLQSVGDFKTAILVKLG